MNYSINSIVSSNKNLKTNKADKKSASITPNQLVSKPDLFEHSNKKTNNKTQNTLNKYAKIIAITAGAIATTAGAIIGIKKLNIKTAKKLEEQARKAAAEQAERLRAESLKREEEVRRIARQKAEQEAKRLEEQARLKAEQEAKVKAEKDAEAKRLAQIAQEKAYQEQIEKLSDGFFQKFGKGETIQINNGTDYKVYSRYTSEEFASGIIDVLKTAEKQGIKEKDLVALYTKIKESPQSAKVEYSADVWRNFYDFGLSKILNSRRNIIKELETLEQSVPRNNTETFGEYIERLNGIRKSNMQQSHVERVRSMLKYEDEISESVELTDEEMKRLIQWKPKQFEGLSKEEALKKLKTYTHSWTEKHTDDYSDTSLYDGIEDILLNKAFPRYNSANTKIKSNDYEIEPLYRWLRILPDNNIYKAKSVDSLVDEYFQVGKEYIAPRIQSCSKTKGSAETYFHDNNSSMNVKLVIHPKGKISKAADIGEGVYGNYEAVYAEGTRFKVIDKHLEECVDTNYVEGCCNDRVFYRWIIDLQEI